MNSPTPSDLPASPTPVSSLHDRIFDAIRDARCHHEGADYDPACPDCLADPIEDIFDAELAAKDDKIERLTRRADLAEAALAGDNEGIRLWMIDCGNLAEKHRKRAEQAAAERDQSRLVVERARKVTEYWHSHAMRDNDGRDPVAVSVAHACACILMTLDGSEEGWLEVARGLHLEESKEETL